MDASAAIHYINCRRRAVDLRRADLISSAQELEDEAEGMDPSETLQASCDDAAANPGTDDDDWWDIAEEVEGLR